MPEAKSAVARPHSARRADGPFTSRNAGLVGVRYCQSGKCAEENPQSLENFNRNKSGPGGYHRYCKSCRKEQRAKYAEHDKARDRRKYQRSREKIIAAAKARYQENKEVRLQQIRAWVQAHPERVQANQARHRATPQGRSAGRKHTQRRRARLRKVEVEGFQHEEVYERDGWVCQLCLLPVDRVLEWPNPLSASLDHVIAVCLGGPHTKVNTQLAHLICNIRKGKAEEVMPK